MRIETLDGRVVGQAFGGCVSRSLSTIAPTVRRSAHVAERRIPSSSSSDHIDGGGTEQPRAWELLPKSFAGSGRRDTQRDTECSCHNCNASLGTWGYCPHQRAGRPVDCLGGAAGNARPVARQCRSGPTNHRPPSYCRLALDGPPPVTRFTEHRSRLLRVIALSSAPSRHNRKGEGAIPLAA